MDSVTHESVSVYVISEDDRPLAQRDYCNGCRGTATPIPPGHYVEVLGPSADDLICLMSLHYPAWRWWIPLTSASRYRREFVASEEQQRTSLFRTFYFSAEEYAAVEAAVLRTVPAIAKTVEGTIAHACREWCDWHDTLNGHALPMPAQDVSHLSPPAAGSVPADRPAAGGVSEIDMPAYANRLLSRVEEVLP